MLPKELDKTPEQVEKGILEGIDSVKVAELNHSEVYDPFLASSAISSANDIFIKFNQDGISPEKMVQILAGKSD